MTCAARRRQSNQQRRVADWVKVSLWIYEKRVKVYIPPIWCVLFEESHGIYLLNELGFLSEGRE